MQIDYFPILACLPCLTEKLVEGFLVVLFTRIQFRGWEMGLVRRVWIPLCFQAKRVVLLKPTTPGGTGRENCRYKTAVQAALCRSPSFDPTRDREPRHIVARSPDWLFQGITMVVADRVCLDLTQAITD